MVTEHEGGTIHRFVKPVLITICIFLIMRNKRSNDIKALEIWLNGCI